MNLTPSRTEVASGDKFTLLIQPPADRRLIAILRVKKDAPILEDGMPDFRLPVLSEIPIQNIQNEHGLGEAFEIEIDTLFYTPGRYTFFTFAPGIEGHLWCQVEILAADQTGRQNALGSFAVGSGIFRLFDINGTELQTEGNTRSLPQLQMGTVYYLGINLSPLAGISEQISVDFRSPDGTKLLSRDLLRIYTFPELSRFQSLSLSSSCPGVDASAIRTLAPIKILPFRTPEHLDYYEYDGQLRFQLDIKTAPNCAEQTLSFDVTLDDSPALPAIPGYKDYLTEHYPQNPERLYRTPLDRRTFKLVRIGKFALTSANELGNAASTIEKAFWYGTKQYFQANCIGTELINWEDHHQIYQKIKAWYYNLPKTPGMPHLSWKDERHRHLAYMMYYSEHPDSFKTDLQQQYPPHSGGEDFTVYIVDGGPSLGSAMGGAGFYARYMRFYNRRGFTETDEHGNTTYHYDTSYFFPGDDGTFDTFWENYLETRSAPDGFANTAVHEMGHIFWNDRVGLSFGDGQDRNLPFYSAPQMVDRSIGYFTRNEFMSYGRNRTTLDGQTYGDDILSKLIEAYQAPMLNLSIKSDHTANSKGYYSVGVGGTFACLIQGDTYSGLRKLSYALIQYKGSQYPTEQDLIGHVELYDPLRGRVKSDSLYVKFTLNTPGLYVYEMTVEDLLEPIPGQVHSDSEQIYILVE